MTDTQATEQTTLIQFQHILLKRCFSPFIKSQGDLGPLIYLLSIIYGNLMVFQGLNSVVSELKEGAFNAPSLAQEASQIVENVTQQVGSLLMCLENLYFGSEESPVPPAPPSSPSTLKALK